MNVCVTGCNGYVGSKLANVLVRDGHYVQGVDVSNLNIKGLTARPNFRFIEADITDRDTLHQLDSVDVVIHCAALVHREWDNLSKEDYLGVNYDGTKNIMLALQGKRLTQFVFLSTVSVYGESGSDTPNESTKTNPMDFYGESKLMAEKVIGEFSKSQQVPCAILRLCPVYSRDFLLNVAKRVYLPKRIAFYKISKGDQRLSLCSANNLIDVILACIKAPALYNGTFIIKDRNDYSINEIIAALRKALYQDYRPVVSIPASLLNLFLRSLSLFNFPGAEINRYKIMKVARDCLFSGDKILSIGTELRWDLESTLRDGADL
jgi:nucleoside-diphosphate-sugar epimerase